MKSKLERIQIAPYLNGPISFGNSGSYTWMEKTREPGSVYLLIANKVSSSVFKNFRLDTSNNSIVEFSNINVPISKFSTSKSSSIFLYLDSSTSSSWVISTADYSTPNSNPSDYSFPHTTNKIFGGLSYSIWDTHYFLGGNHATGGNKVYLNRLVDHAEMGSTIIPQKIYDIYTFPHASYLIVTTKDSSNDSRIYFMSYYSTMTPIVVDTDANDLFLMTSGSLSPISMA